MNHTKRILIVDDEESNRSLLEALVASLGYQCCLASDGCEALGCLDPNIDLVLLDIVMPGLNGYEVARQIRSGRACPDVPIVMVSGLDNAEDRLKAEQAGANFFVAKPVDQAQLRSRIAALLDDAGHAGVA